MFLALNEIRHDKTRFFLIIGVIFLISYLVFFLTGLAYGLASSYSNAINKWDSDSIIYSKDSNDNITMSMLSSKELDNVSAENKAALSAFPAIIRKTEKNVDDNYNAYLFGIDPSTFIAPNIEEGRMFENNGEVTADISLKKEGFNLGDKIYFAGDYDGSATIVGFTKSTKYQVSPVLYTSFEFFSDYRFARDFDKEDYLINAIVTKGNDVKSDNKDLKIMPIDDYIFKLPGYSAQVLTFGLMIGFLILISALIIGIFIYVLTIQKVNMFGVMKAQGIQNTYISTYVISKTVLISSIGVALGLVLTLLTILFLPNSVPFVINPLFFMIIVALFVVFAFAGALFSVRMVTKIDPLVAMRA